VPFIEVVIGKLSYSFGEVREAIRPPFEAKLSNTHAIVSRAVSCAGRQVARGFIFGFCPPDKLQTFSFKSVFATQGISH
jgi:hypothetical protein